MSSSKKKTYCRICEAACGLEVELSEDQEILSIKPDKEHPVTQGYACIKGTTLDAIHDDVDRVNYPLKRIDGELVRVSWEQALSEIGSKIVDLQTEHGNRAIGMYNGNPTYFSFQNIMFSTAFMDALGSPNMFCSHSIDCNNKMEAATHMFGSSSAHAIPDLKNCDFFMIFGCNPVVSQMSFFSVINPLEKLKEIEASGGKVVFVDPRKTETAAKVGEQLFIKPGTDVFLLLAMLHVVAYENDIEKSTLAENIDGVEEFLAIAKDWAPERVAATTGISAKKIRQLSNQYLNTEAAALYMSTGVNMGPFGTLAYWILTGLNLVTNKFDQKGGLLVPNGPFDALKLGKDLGLDVPNEHRTLTHGWHKVSGNFPSAALADEIDIDHPERIRALIVSAGNPVHSLPNGQALSRSMEKLDFVVSIDIYQNETSAHADYILPATGMLERADYPLGQMLLQETPYAQFTKAMVQPKYERREEWRIFCDIVLAAKAEPGLQNLCIDVAYANSQAGTMPFMSELAVIPEHILDGLLQLGDEVTLEKLKSAPEGILLRPHQAQSFLGKRVPTDNGKVQLYAGKLVDDLARLDTVFNEFDKQVGRLQLIGRRDRRTHNSWMLNNHKIKHPDSNYALMNTTDAASRNIESGDCIKIFSGQGSAILKAAISDDILCGVIAVPHGWGHRRTQLSKASKLAGENINTVIPGGSHNMEPISGQAIMTGHFVDVIKHVVEQPA